MSVPYREDPMLILAEALMGGSNGVIERQEKRGQNLLVNSTVLPIKFNWGKREHLEKFGVVFGEPVDDLFCNATLPGGWKKVATEHSMWSKLVDDKGRERASIFYKAAFYDREAFLNSNRRFSYGVQPVDGWESKNYRKGDWHCVVTDCDNVIWKSEHMGGEPDSKEEMLDWIKAKDKFGETGKQWLTDNYPDFENPAAYWD